MAKTVRRILLLATVTLLIGIIIAYYNTSLMGYDNANIISFNREGVRVFDYNIEYTEIHDFFEKVDKTFPKDLVTI